MSSKDTCRSNIIRISANLAKEREQKKKDNESYARQIAAATTPARKAALRKDKMNRAAVHDNRINQMKRELEGVRKYMKSLK